MITLATRNAHPASDNPIDAVLRIPHPALLIGVSLAFLSVVSGLSVRHQVHLAGAWPVGIVITLLVACVAALAALALLTARPAQTMPATLVGIVLLDTLAVVMQFGSLDPTGARARVLFLVIPTVIAASSLAPAAHRVHLSGVMLLAAVMVGVPDAGRGPLDRILEACVAVAVLLTADLLVRRLSSATAERIFQLRALSLTDGLTGVLNRRGLTVGFARLLRGARRDGPFGLLIADIDHFKWFNDEYGHAAGDDVLRRVCQVLTEVAGPGALVARIGGEEIAALVPGHAEPVAQAFRSALEQLRPRVTVSVGVIDATQEECAEPGTLWRLLDAADHALYEAKNTGRNRICRGTIDDADPADEPPPRAAHPAAVPLEGITAATPPRGLPAWALTAFGVAGLVTVFAGDSVVFRPVDWALLAVALACLVAGVVLIGVAPRHGERRFLSCVAAVDVLIALAVLAIRDPAADLTALLPLLLTGLVVAQYCRRVAITSHHVAVGIICLLAVGDSITLLGTAAAVLHAVVLIGSAELIYHLRRRHDAAAQDLHRWSVTDPLTGLANRRGLEMAFARIPRTGNITVLALDVDDFKSVNDRHGHAVGDDALIRLAATLRTVTGAGTVVGRTGGDEFVVVAPAAHAGTLTSKVSRAAALLPVPLSVSVGSTVAAPYHRHSLWQLVAAADAGLTRAKRQSRRHAAGGPDGDTVRTPDAATAAGSSTGSSATNGAVPSTTDGGDGSHETTRPALRAVQDGPDEPLATTQDGAATAEVAS